MPHMQRSTITFAMLALVFGLAVFWVWSKGRAGEVTPEAAAVAAVSHSDAAAEAQPSVERTSAPSTPPAATAADPGAAAAGPTGSLRVRVRNERGDALAGCRVTAAEHAATTDAAGEATFTVPAVRTSVSVAPPDGFGLTPVAGWQNVRPDATVELVVVLKAPTQTSFWCRLVAAEDEKPLAGVALREEPAGRTLTSDGAGFVQCLTDDLGYLEVALAGRAPCRILLLPEHATREQALVVKLTLGTTLRAHVVDAGGAPVSGAVLELSAFAFSLQQPEMYSARGRPFRWRGESDLDGRITIEDLPRDATLIAKVSAPTPFAAPAEERWAFTAKEERRTIVLALAGGVQGRVLDATGAPVADVAVQANAPAGDQLPRTLGITPDAWRTRSAADGTFRIAGLAAGRWWVGVSANGAHAPTARLVEVIVGRDTEVELQALPGLAVAGRTVAPDGSAARGVEVELHLDGNLVASVASDAAGAFRFTHVPAGVCELRTGPYATYFGLPAPFAAEAGDERIELRLVAIAGSLGGRCVGSSDAWVSAHRRGSDHVFATRCDLDGAFFYGGMRAGTWDVVAVDRSGGVGWLAGVQVAPGRTTEGLTLDMQPGGELRPRHASADTFVVQRGADVAASDALEPGVPGRAYVPAGDWTVVFLHEGREVARRTATVRAGERIVVDGGS